jgi:hypothetical protein
MLEAQVNASIDGILMVGAQGQTLLTNKRMGEMWGIPPPSRTTSTTASACGSWSPGPGIRRNFSPGSNILYAHPRKPAGRKSS